MAYDDDDDDQYRQYEDEMYKDFSEDGDEIESDVEANLLGHIHYSSDLSKTLGMQNGTKHDTNSEGSPTAASSEHLAELAAPTESYFKADTHSAEQENGSEQASGPLSTKHRLGEDDEEESRYSVTKKRDSKNTSAQASPSKLDTSDESDSDSVADFEDEEEGYEGSDDDDDDDEIVEDKQEMQEHVIDLASLMNGTAPEVGDAPATDLSHLEDEKFKNCPTIWREYEYLPGKSESNTVVAYCYNCADVGHFGDECNIRRPPYAQHVTSAFTSGKFKNPSSRSNRDDYRSNDYSNDRDRRRDYDRYDRDRDRDYDRHSGDKKKGRDRDRDRDRDRGRDRDRRQEKEGDKYRSRNRDRDRDPENDRSYDDYRSRNSTSQSTPNNAPTMATGGTVYTHPLPTKPTPRPNNNRPSSRPSSRRNSPERISRPEASSRKSFAEQNAFPRGGGGGSPRGGSGVTAYPANHGAEGLIGAVRQSDRNGQAGPMYTGGYSRTSIDPRARN
ncbi:hypothetical protein BGZ93_005921 [Podila epicladia]|nr:hypothetical protein BGZ93_005921 [Podila epicladia]